MDFSVSAKLDMVHKMYDFAVKMITLFNDRETKIYYTAILDCMVEIFTCIITANPNDRYPKVNIDKKLITLIQSVNDIQTDMNENYIYLEKRRRRLKYPRKKQKRISDDTSCKGSDDESCK